MRSTLGERRKNALNFRRRKGKWTERKNTVKMYGTVED